MWLSWASKLARQLTWYSIELLGLHPRKKESRLKSWKSCRSKLKWHGSFSKCVFISHLLLLTQSFRLSVGFSAGATLFSNTINLSATRHKFRFQTVTIHTTTNAIKHWQIDVRLFLIKLYVPVTENMTLARSNIISFYRDVATGTFDPRLTNDPGLWMYVVWMKSVHTISAMLSLSCDLLP